MTSTHRHHFSSDDGTREDLRRRLGAIRLGSLPVDARHSHTSSKKSTRPPSTPAAPDLRGRSLDISATTYEGAYPCVHSSVPSQTHFCSHFLCLCTTAAAPLIRECSCDERVMLRVVESFQVFNVYKNYALQLCAICHTYIGERDLEAYRGILTLTLLQVCHLASSTLSHTTCHEWLRDYIRN